MKTFKLLQLEVQGHDIPLIDGVIINQENSRQSWLLEAFVKEADTLFTTLCEQQTVVPARAVISFPDNEPAPFEVVVRAVKPIESGVSILFSGKLVARRSQYAEKLLSSLLAQDLEEEELLTQFKAGMRNRPRL